jgi:hypothetical protein
VLNEAFQVVNALDARGVTIDELHPSLTPMGKNAPLLVVDLDKDGAPSKLSILPGEVAGRLLRICHGSQGASFPGFNLPTPLRVFKKVEPAKLGERFSVLRRRRPDAKRVGKFVAKLNARSQSAEFTRAQSKQFQRSLHELVGWLQDDFRSVSQDLANFTLLLRVVGDANLELAPFAAQVASLLAAQANHGNAEEKWLIAEWLFTKGKLPVYLQCVDEDQDHYPVADVRMGRLLNCHLLDIGARLFDSKSRSSSAVTESARDAYSGQNCKVPDSFPSPKLALLGNVRLFSNNTEEAGCFFRYGLGGSKTFKVSKAMAQRMAGALLQLASDDHLHKTCRGIPSNRGGQQDLLVAYLEDEPDAPDPYVDLFGSEAPSFDTPDFAAAAEPVLEALAGKVAANPNQLIRLIAISSLDKANKQISLSRGFTVRQVLEAAQAWHTGAANCPSVKLPFYDKQAKKVVFKEQTVIFPLEVASTLNRVWASGRDGAFTPAFQRIITVCDAYDIFVGPLALRGPKTRFALQTVLARMRNVFGAAGALKATSAFELLNQPTRWQVLKAVSLIGILLHQLDQRHEVFMKDSIYQVGRLLALADSLHFQYCKWVRTSEKKREQGKVDAPTELVGNSLFNFALDNPVAALARLAERIKPYKGWADTYSGESAGLVHWFAKQMANSESQLDIAMLPSRMGDIHKAQLLLGYLADHPKSE